MRSGKADQSLRRMVVQEGRWRQLSVNLAHLRKAYMRSGSSPCRGRPGPRHRLESRGTSLRGDPSGSLISGQHGSMVWHTDPRRHMPPARRAEGVLCGTQQPALVYLVGGSSDKPPLSGAVFDIGTPRRAASCRRGAAGWVVNGGVVVPPGRVFATSWCRAAPDGEMSIGRGEQLRAFLRGEVACPWSRRERRASSARWPGVHPCEIEHHLQVASRVPVAAQCPSWGVFPAPHDAVQLGVSADTHDQRIRVGHESGRAKQGHRPRRSHLPGSRDFEEVCREGCDRW